MTLTREQLALRADNLRVSDLQTRMTLINNVLRLRDLLARALGGTVAAEADVQSGRGGITARVREVRDTGDTPLRRSAVRDRSSL